VSLLAAACSTAARPSALPTAKGASASPTPSYEPIYVGPTKGFRVRDILVSASITPIVVRWGDEIRVTITLRNREARAQTGLIVSWSLGTRAQWKLGSHAKGAEVSGYCANADQAGGCGEAHILYRNVSIPPRATRSFVMTAKLVEMRCPARGDFWDEFGMGTSGPMKHGATRYLGRVWFENSASDYVQARADRKAPPVVPPSTCDPDPSTTP
jgi:hypothetical protein